MRSREERRANLACRFVDEGATWHDAFMWAESILRAFERDEFEAEALAGIAALPTTTEVNQ